MAEFIDDSVDDSLQEGEERQEIEQAEELTPEPVQQTEEDDLPEKYKGKDLKEIARMHQEAEKLIGRQGSEVGELRKIVDDFIKAQASSKQQPQEPVEEVDFFSDPEKAVSKAIENHPKIKQAEQAALQMKIAETVSMLKEKHPDFMQIAESSPFQEWVKSSKVRVQLFAAANNYDFDAADELLTIWKERKQVADATIQAEKQDRDRVLRSATATAAKSSEEVAPKKIYRRADIIKLMQTDPDRYDAMQPEIMAAYQEGRVR
jgi:predicted RNA-binding protein YlqC (UPF0109 family)